MHLKQDYQFRTIWDVIGRVRGSELPDEWVVAGNHRDAWVYGAVDPNSGTAAMLESVHGIGELLKSGWKPKRTIVFGSWDAEEEGLIGSTEWGEQHEAELANAVAYFNMDVAVSGPKFGASSVPTLKQFIRDVTKVVPSPKGGMVYDEWRKTSQSGADTRAQAHAGHRRHGTRPGRARQLRCSGRRPGQRLRLHRLPAASGRALVRRGFDRIVRRLSLRLRQLQLVQEIWRSRFRLRAGDGARLRTGSHPHGRTPTCCPTTTRNTARKSRAYIDAASKKVRRDIRQPAAQLCRGGPRRPSVRAGRSEDSAASRKIPAMTLPRLNQALRQAERALLIPEGLPNRPWFRHAIYAPGQYTGYAAVVIPGVNEAIDKHDLERTRQQIAVLAAALNRAAKVLEDYR